MESLTTAETALAIEREERVEPVIVTVGVDIGQRRDPTAIVVSELEERATGKWIVTGRSVADSGAEVTHRRPETETVYNVRFIERMQLGTPYPDVAARVSGIVAELTTVPLDEVYVVLDATGVGRPIVDLVRDELRDLRCHACAATFTATARMDGTIRRRELSVGKPWLVSRLQALLQTRRIKLPETPEARQLAKELADFEIKVNEKTAHLSAGALRVGAHDDLVSALGLSVLHEPLPPVTTGPSIY